MSVRLVLLRACARTLVASSVVVSALTFTGAARGQPDPMPGFDWEAPEGCPSEASVKEAVRTLVRTGSATVGTRVRATATAGPPWTARIHFENGDERGDRELAALSCEALGQAVALVVALAIDRAETAPTEPEPPPATPATPTPTPGPSPDAAEKPNPAPADAERRFATHAGLTARSGLVPAIAPGLEAGVAWTQGALELSARGALFTRSSTSARGPDGVATVTGSFLLATAQAHVGWVLRPAQSIRVVPFGGIGLAYLSGAGQGAEVDQEAVDWLPMPFAGVEGRARFGSLEPYLAFEGGVPLGRSSFHFRGMNEPIFQPELVSLRASAGVRLLLF